MLRLCFPIMILFLLLSTSCNKEDNGLVASKPLSKFTQDWQAQSKNGVVNQRVPLIAFQPAGDLGGDGNLLQPGTFFPPKGSHSAKLSRASNYLQFNIHTKGLPPGAYTVWWIIFNDPSTCTTPSPLGLCGEPDLFGSKTAVLWATGKIVQSNGVGNFSDRLYVGETRSETVLMGEDLDSPLEYPQTAEVHLIVKYHGAASDNSDILYLQMHTLLGNCGADEGANSFDAGPFGIQCFDPQAAIFQAP
ncbi:MAG: hypothetical protein HKN87_00130 [Saprospiraceae bacterium]|nr:hypothetical protein [Saprospiraceae bacterium]